MRIALLLGAGLLGLAGAAEACAPPPGFQDRAPPAPGVHPVTHTETVLIRRPLSQVLRSLDGLSLEDTIDKTSSLPHVTGTHDLTPGGFGKAGARRLVCLSDGSTLAEQIVETTTGQRKAVFRYVVWNYTSAQARPVDYAEGAFVREQLTAGVTRVTWTYSFHLKSDRFPGSLGPAGRLGFRKLFLERGYAAMMRRTLGQEKARAER